MRAAVLLATVGALACAHSDAFEPDTPEPRGPMTDAFPIRLTFNVGDDRSPSGSGDLVVYSRYDPGRGTAARCVAALPAAGGALRASWCPPAPSAADTFVSTWLEPALSADGRLLAFVWQRGAAVSALAAWSHHLVVVSVDSPAVPLVEALLADQLPDGRRYDTAILLRWTDAGRLLFLAALDSIAKVKGGGAARFTDTTAVPVALFELDPSIGTATMVPGGDGVIAYAPAPGGGLWVVTSGAPGDVSHLDGAGAVTPIASVGTPIIDLAVVNGRAVVATGVPMIQWLEPASGMSGVLTAPGPVRRLTATAGRQLVAEVEADERAFGAPANLWLFELPPLPPL